MALVRMTYVETVTVKGRTYRYYRRGGKRLAKLPGIPGSVEFMKAYAEAHERFEHPAKVYQEDITVPDSFKEMAVAYEMSPEFKALSGKTRKLYGWCLNILKRQAVLGSENRRGIRRNHILAIRDGAADTPAKANSLVKTVRLVYRWGITRGWADSNPADFTGTDVRPLKIGEHKPWPEPSIQKFLSEGREDLRLVVAVGLYTGQRIGDCLKMGWGDISDGSITVKQEKTRKDLGIPLHRDLKILFDSITKKSTRILTAQTGRVWTYTNFCDQFMAERIRLGLQEFVFHGLRKNAVIRLLDAGCSVKEVGSITGQSDEMVLYYARLMEQKSLAKTAMAKLEKWGPKA